MDFWAEKLSDEVSDIVKVSETDAVKDSSWDWDEVVVLLFASGDRVSLSDVDAVMLEELEYE